MCSIAARGGPVRDQDLAHHWPPSITLPIILPKTAVIVRRRLETLCMCIMPWRQCLRWHSLGFFTLSPCLLSISLSHIRRHPLSCRHHLVQAATTPVILRCWT